ncbi:SPFH domain-containing protein [Bifidobacterium simiiventris]|uniref:SPFH domain-containing protein n=1 Tax=Bifidobacterium simiiventris TaxID=2834434 RepID=UPI001C56157B|nr:SPFH domain-containing protein [Bifidobacterium simiiventris]MBW3079016.1 SPFH domain-containing protein [Bifidobacterium simiiventris]
MPLHLIDIVRYEGGDQNKVFAWKHPNTALKPGTKLDVMPHQLAVFVRSGRIAQTYAEGRHTVAGQSTPFLTGVTKMFTGGVDPYSSMLYFINVFDQTGMQWGTSDPIQIPVPGTVSARSTGLSIPAGAHGRYSIALAYDHGDDPQTQQRNSDHLQAFFEQFVSGHDEVTRSKVADLVRQRVNMIIRDQISKAFTVLNLPINQIDSHTAQINDEILRQLAAANVFGEFEQRYGLRILDFVTDAIVVDKGSEEYRVYNRRAQAYEDKASNAESGLYQANLDSRSSMAHTDAMAYDQQQRAYTYQQKRTMDVLHTAADNKGTGSDLLSGGIGVGVGVHAAGTIARSLGKAIRESMSDTDFAASGSPVAPAQPSAEQAVQAAAAQAAQQVAAAGAAQSQPEPAPAAESAAAPTQAAAPADPVEALTKLKQLHDLKLISDDQFAAKQQEILSRL